jgi:pyridoxamine 5'-phosphate oxidase
VRAARRVRRARTHTRQHQRYQTATFPRPPFWGGYYVWADSVELWIEGASRIHERARWTRSLTTAGDGFRARPWSATRLQP